MPGTPPSVLVSKSVFISVMRMKERSKEVLAFVFFSRSRSLKSFKFESRV